MDHFIPKEAPHNKLLPVGITSEPSSLPPAGSAEEGGRVGKYQEETGSSKVFKIWQPEAEEPYISGLSVLVQDRAGATFKGGLLWLELAS